MIEKIKNKNELRYEAIKICLIYVVIGFAWILLSDRIVNKLINNKNTLIIVSTYKGWVYVLLTAIILYMLITSFIKKIDIKDKELFKSYEELSETYEELEATNEELIASEEELHKQVDDLNIIRKKLLESERRLNKAQAMGSIGNWEIDLTTNEVWASEEAIELYGLTSENGLLKLKDIQQVVNSNDRTKLDTSLKLLVENNIKYDVEFRINKTDTKEERYMHSIAEIQYNGLGTPIRVLGVIQDITSRKEYEIRLQNSNEELSSLYEELAASEEELRQQLDEIIASKELLEISEEKYKTLVNNSQDIIYSCDTDGVFLAVNNMFSKITKIDNSKIIGKKMSDFISNSTFIELWQSSISKVITTGETLILENKYKDDLIFNVTLSPIFNIKNDVIGVTGTNHNITESKKSEQIIKHMAYYDDLTDLPNRVFFFDTLKKEITLCREKRNKMAILFLDMDNFKRINDSLGHAFGDKLLIEVAMRLKACIRVCDIVARISGDEFSILIKDFLNINETIPIIDNILNVFSKPFNIGNSSINITSSIGVSIFPRDGEIAEDLFKNADIAMYKAKEIGKNCYQFYNANMKTEILRKLNIEVMLRKGIIEDEFLVHYQPQFDSKTKMLRGFEALVRWNNPEFGFLSPMEFIPVAEETGLIGTIGEFVLNNACNFIKKINDKYKTNLIIAVNISPIQLKQVNFYDIVTNTIDKSGIIPHNLELEVTENVFIDNFDFALKILRDLKKYGVRIALDDFGTGYSSLSYLKKLPIDLLKIDKCFIDEICEANSKNDFTDVMISLVHKLNIEALAEGVENKFQYEYLVNADIDSIQGFYLGKPLSEEDTEKLIIKSEIFEFLE